MSSVPAPSVTGDVLAESHRYCQQLARRTAGNFYYTFLTLPRERFQAMCALYAFMRITDDLGDSDDAMELRKEALERWRESLSLALADGVGDHPLHPALVDVLRKYEVPATYLRDVITGVEMDLGQVVFATFADLERYCYHVAGAVGLACIHIWGFHDERAKAAATDCGLAFQLTNILRDLAEDAEQGRTYLPEEDLVRFGYGADDIALKVRDERFTRLMQFETDRARDYYSRANRLLEYLDPPGVPIFEAMLGIYGGLLQAIIRRKFDVYSSRVRLSRWRKTYIAARALVGQRLRRLWGRA